MKATKTLLVAALAAAGLAATTAADAQSRGGHGGGGHSARGASGGGGHTMSGRSGSGNWSGRGHGNWNGRTAGYRGGHWGGGYRGSYWGPRVGFYFGVPLFWGGYYGYPYYSSYPYYADYPSTTVIYRDREVEPYPLAMPEDEAPATDIAPNAEGAPTQGPTYMNYCESARAYYPKVTQCPEGWKFVPSR